MKAPLCAGVFFVCKIACVPACMREAKRTVKMEVPKNESENYTGLHRVQTAQLQHHEEQEEQPRPAGDEEVLPFLQKAYYSSRDKVRKAEQYG